MVRSQTLVRLRSPAEEGSGEFYLGMDVKVVYILRIIEFCRATALNVPEGSPTGIRYCLSIFIFGDVLSDFRNCAKSLALTI